MNFSKLLKPLAQGLVDAALPALKAQIKARITAALLASPKFPALVTAAAILAIEPAIDDWTIKL